MELIFNTSLSIEEIEKNFEDVDVFENLMAALGEALLMEEQRKKEGQQTSLLTFEHCPYGISHSCCSK